MCMMKIMTWTVEQVVVVHSDLSIQDMCVHQQLRRFLRLKCIVITILTLHEKAIFGLRPQQFMR